MPYCRRQFLIHAATLAGAGLVAPLTRAAANSAGGEKHLKLRNLHTNECLSLPYWADGHYIEEAMQSFNRLLRDHRNGQVTEMDPCLLDSVHRLVEVLDGGEVQIISGYRSPETNEKLRRQGRGVAKNSLHIQGRAIDIRLAGKDLKTTLKAARRYHRGGVGYYPRSGFIHIDSGRERYWVQS